jgi:undecaprenyl-phosphate 4-deoxy-4-formamido-L-arabinose transferase
MLLSGVQLLILGIIGEYLGRLYLTANRKPQSVVRSVMRADPLSGDSPVGWESRSARELQPRLPERA